jgi:hypothetical protein
MVLGSQEVALQGFSHLQDIVLEIVCHVLTQLVMVIKDLPESTSTEQHREVL